MKGKKGGESATSGVTFTTSAIPCTSKGNILAAAKKRKRGGAVAMKVEGDAPKARLDKPKRARGGAADSNVSRQTAKASSQLSDMMAKRAASPKSSDAAGSTAMKMMETSMPKPTFGSKTGPALKSKALRADRGTPARASGGKIGDGDYDSPGQKIRDQVDDNNADDTEDRKRGGRAPKRARGGQIGADTKPMSHAAAKRPMRGHATQPNIT